ncbi:unnamed protein product, partial [Rotaria sp. Silwood2]
MLEILVDPKFETLPIAVISSLSNYKYEEEVVLMWGTIYKINSFIYDERKQFWIINISLSDELGETKLKNMVDYIKHEIKQETDLGTLADLFFKMGEFERSKMYYLKFNSQLSKDDINKTRVFQGLYEIADVQGNYNISMENYGEAHKCFDQQLKLCQSLPSHHPQYGKCYENIANLYDIEGEKRSALVHYEKAYEIYIKSLPAYHPDTTKVEQAIENCRLPTRPFADIEGTSYYPHEREILFMLGSIFRIDHIDYDGENQLWIINMSLCSEDDFELKELFAYLKKDIGYEISMTTLCNVLLQMGDYDKAERIFLRMDHQEGLISVAELKGNFYLAIKHYDRSIEYYKQSLELRHKLLPQSHPDI